MRFLIDECLHTSLIGVANQAGHEAHHVVYRAWAGLEDHELCAIILREEFLLVTNNGRDFLELLAEAELHPGLVDHRSQREASGSARDVSCGAQDNHVLAEHEQGHRGS